MWLLVSGSTLGEPLTYCELYLGLSWLLRMSFAFTCSISIGSSLKSVLRDCVLVRFLVIMLCNKQSPKFQWLTTASVYFTLADLGVDYSASWARFWVQASTGFVFAPHGFILRARLKKQWPSGSWVFHNGGQMLQEGWWKLKALACNWHTVTFIHISLGKAIHRAKLKVRGWEIYSVHSKQCQRQGVKKVWWTNNK